MKTLQAYDTHLHSSYFGNALLGRGKLVGSLLRWFWSKTLVLQIKKKEKADGASLTRRTAHTS